MKVFWKTRKGWQKGFLIGVSILVLGIFYALFEIGRGYNGVCGGLLPFLSGSNPCTFFEYIWPNLNFTFAVITSVPAFWIGVAVVLVVPTLIGYIIDKKKPT